MSIATEVSTRKNSRKKSMGESEKGTGRMQFFPIQRQNTFQKARKIGIINPDSMLNVVWEVFMLLGLLIRVLIIPYEISFAPEMIASARYAIIFTDLACLADIFINFNTGYYFKGFLIIDRSEITKKYLSGAFIIDFIGSVPFQIFISDSRMIHSGEFLGINSFRFILLVKFVHLYRIKSAIYMLEDRFTSIHSVTALKFFHFSLLICFMLHWSACLSYLFYLQELEIDGDLWSSYIQDEGFRYLSFLYYMVFTITSIGYYALNISTTNQRTVTILIMCCDIIIFAYILGKIESTLKSYQHEGNETKRMLRMCKVYISQNKIPRGLRHKILKYVAFCRENQRKGDEKESDLLNSLSLPLREEIFTQTRGFMLAKQPLFRIYNDSFLKFMGYHLKLQIFGPQDSIFEEDEHASTVYFIQNGRIEIYHARSSTTFKVLKRGKCFGEISFFLGTRRCASARSEGFSEVLTLPRNVMNTILTYRPMEKNITEKMIIEAGRVGLSILYVRCYLCNKLGHVASTCKEYMIPLRMDKIMKKSDPSKYTGPKKINLNEGFKFSFQRSEPNNTINKYLAINTSGKRFLVSSAYGSRPSLMKSALGYNMRRPLKINKAKKLTIMEEEESSSENEEKSPLPLGMQYRSAFLQRSRDKASKREQKEAIEIFDEESVPRLYLNLPVQ